MVVQCPQTDTIEAPTFPPPMPEDKWRKSLVGSVPMTGEAAGVHRGVGTIIMRTGY